jgi:hypothetical protein
MVRIEEWLPHARSTAKLPRISLVQGTGLPAASTAHILQPSRPQRSSDRGRLLLPQVGGRSSKLWPSRGAPNSQGTCSELHSPRNAHPLTSTLWGVLLFAQSQPHERTKQKQNRMESRDGTHSPSMMWEGAKRRRQEKGWSERDAAEEGGREKYSCFSC